MAKFLLLGDSNIANNLQHQAVIGKGQFEFKKCTTKGLFIDKILAAQLDFVVMAGIDCIVNEALTAPRESERSISLVLNYLVSKIVEKLESEESSNMTVVLASPLYWNDFTEDVKKSLQSTYKQIRKDWKHRIKFLPPCPGMTFLQDRVHLDELSGVRYTNHVIKKSCSLAKIIPNPASNPSWADDAELQLMDDEEMEQDDSQIIPDFTLNRSTSAALRTPQLSMSTGPAPNGPPLPLPLSTGMPASSQLLHQPPFYMPPPAQQASMLSQPFHQIVTLPSQGPTNQELTQKIEDLAKRMDMTEDKAYYDNLTFAAIKEDQDDLSNRNNLDRITLTGVKIENFNRMAENEKPAAMKAAVNSIIELVTPEADRQERQVVFTRHKNRHIREAKSVVIEARFQNAKQATAFRKEFVATCKKLKADEELPALLEGVATFPIQTLGTRVRAALLRAMARVVDSQTGPNITAFCQPFLTRPMLKIVTKMNDSTSVQSYGFVDSILKLKSNKDLHRVSRDEAYQTAGSNFRGRLEQHFVILRDC